MVLERESERVLEREKEARTGRKGFFFICRVSPFEAYPFTNKPSRRRVLSG